VAENDPSGGWPVRRRAQVREELMLADHALRRALDLMPRDLLSWQDVDEARLALRVAIDRVGGEGAPRG
jgi:hypothetical protein